MNGGIQLHNTGAVTAANYGVWRTSGTNFLGDGATSVTNGSGGVIAIDGTTTLDFGLGANSFTNQGTIVFGSGADSLSTNGSPTDRLQFSGPGYVASGSMAKLMMDVNFTGAGQASCAAAVTADCFDLRGLSTSGTTSIVVNSLGGMGSLKPIVLVDVNGGTSAAGDFTLSMDSTGYTDVGTSGGIDTGLFVYRLAYDAATQRHELVPYAGAGAHTFALTGAALRSVWDTTTGSWFNRQADLQDTIAARGSGSGPGVWLKAAGGHVQRTYKPGSDVGGDIKVFDDSYSQSTKGLVGGIDFLNVQSGDQAWVAGVTAGKVKADVDFTVGSSKVKADGESYGAYASFLSGGFFVDGIVNANKLDLKFDGAGFSGVKAKADTLGWQAETGYRLSDSAGAIFIEPLLTLAYVTTDVKDLPISGNLTVSFDKAKSFRGAVGARLGGKLELQNFIAGMAITGRVWDEFKGDNGIRLESGDQAMALTDASDGALGDVGATFNLISKDGRWSGFADYSFKFMDDYSDSQASVGLRFNW
ncbi:MAG: autotransporter outer membrane beta-barrel domain-containing protein [Parcubacteria group bacterium]